MGSFPELNKTDGRQLIPISGRGLFLTDSPTAEFVGHNQRECFPLAPYNGVPTLLAEGACFVIPIEADGFIAILPGAKYAFHEAAEYARFEFNPSFVVLNNLYHYVPPVVLPPPVVVDYITYMGRRPDGAGITGYSVYTIVFTDTTQGRYQIGPLADYGRPVHGSTKHELQFQFQASSYYGPINTSIPEEV